MPKATCRFTTGLAFQEKVILYFHYKTINEGLQISAKMENHDSIIETTI